MTRLRHNASLPVLQHQTEGMTLNLQTPILRFVSDDSTIAHATPRCRRRHGTSQHGALAVLARGSNGRGQHADAYTTRAHEVDLQLQVRVVVVSSIREVEHLHAHRPVAIEVERLTRRQPIALPVDQSLALRHVECRQRVCQEVGITEVTKVARHVLGHTLQVLNAGIGLELGRGGQHPTQQRYCAYNHLLHRFHFGILRTTKVVQIERNTKQKSVFLFLYL